MLYLRPQRVYKPSALSYLVNPSDIADSIIDRYSNKDLYRLRIETPRGASITADNSQITCYAHIFDKEDGTELTDLLKGRGFRPTWLLDGKPIDSARISEEGYQITLETDNLPAIYQTVTLQARDTDILLALTTDEIQKRIYSQLIELGSIPTNLIKTSEKLLDIHYLDKLRIDGIEIVKQELSKEIAANTTALSELHKHPLTISEEGYWRIWDIKQHQYVTTEYQSRGEKGEPGATGAKGERGERGYRGYQGEAGATGEKGPKGDTPKLTLDSQYRLLADGALVSMESLRGPKGDKPVMTLDSQYRLLADGVQVSEVSLKGERGERGETGARGATGQTGPQGEAGHSPRPEDVLATDLFRQKLSVEVSTKVTPVANDLSKAKSNITNLQGVALTPEMRKDLDYLTNSLQVLRSGDNSFAGLKLQRHIALSGDGANVSAYIASKPMEAVLKAGITDFGTPQEREQVEITHQGTGHLGNLYFAGDTIDFRKDKHTDPYLSIGAEEATFIETFVGQARQDDTPVSVSSVSLTASNAGYQRTISVDNDGTRLTITLDKINVAVYMPSTLRLTLDGVTIAEWQGKTTFTDPPGNIGAEGGGKGFKVETEPYEASNLTYERVVRAGSHIVRLAVVNPTSGQTASVTGLRVRRRYDTGAQQSLLTKSGLRLFGSPDRYLDVDYRPMYRAKLGFGNYIVPNPYLLRIKGGAKVDRLEVDKIEGAGAKLSPIVTPQLGLGGQTTLYPKYDEWVLTSDARAQYISFSGLNAEIGKSIYIQTRRKAYLYANGHSFFGLPGDASKGTAVDQWLSNNTTYRFVRANATAWLVTASSSPYPWT